MKEFDIDFAGWCTIKAESKEEAIDKFWAGLQAPSEDVYNDNYEIYSIEEVEV